MTKKEIEELKLAEAKYHAFSLLLTDYSDYFGRVCIYHSSKQDAANGKFDSENQHLWTGQAAILARLLRQFIGEDSHFAIKINIRSVLQNTKVAEGLWARHPWWLFKGGHELSHDEHNGMMFYCAAFGANHIAKELVDYGKKHSWAFVEESQNFDPVKDLIKNPFSRLKQVFQNIIEFRKTGDVHSRNESKLSRIRLPADRCLMKIVAKVKPNWFEVLNMAAALVLSARKPYKKAGSKIMSFYKFKTLEFMEFENKMINFAKKYFHKKCKAMYGKEYLNVLNGIYYKDPNHPFHTLTKGLTLISEE